MSSTTVLEPSQTLTLPLLNEPLMDEIESLNAIYGEGTLRVNKVKKDGVEALFRLPAISLTDRIVFCLKFPITYPESVPEYLYADVGLHQSLDRRVQNIGLMISVFLDQVFVPSNVCVFDLIDAVVPAVDCMTGYSIDLAEVSSLYPQLPSDDWRWVNKPFINMNNFKDRGECFICCDEMYAFKMVQVPCKHFYCFTCLQTGWDLAFTSVEPFNCCAIEIPVDAIRVVTTISNNDYKDYIRQLLERDTWNPFFCGNKTCTALIGSMNLWDLGRGTAKVKGILCPKCKQRTCSLCRDIKHSGDCVVDLDMVLLFKRRDIRRCPRCGEAIEKNGGCSHMTCGGCHTEFTWESDGSLGPYRGRAPWLNVR